MTPLEKQLAEVLVKAKTKLTVYFEQTGGEYAGGPIYNILRKEIDEALAAYDVEREWEQNSFTHY